MRWRCNDCHTTHAGNVSQCTNCGHTILTPDDGSVSTPDRPKRQVLGVLALALLTIVLTVAFLLV